MLLAGVLTVVTAGGLVVAGQASAASAASRPEIRVLSNRADLVTGGDALVEVAPPRGASVAELRVTLNGEDITSAFGTGSSAQPRGLVEGLVVGDDTVTARLGNGPASKLTITNSSDTGPVFAGPQVQP